MTRQNWRGISPSKQYAIANAWKTDEGTEHLCTGPITWRSDYEGKNVFERFQELGWSVQNVNENLTEALYEELVGSGLIDSLIADLLERAQEEWAEKQQGAGRTE